MEKDFYKSLRKVSKSLGADLFGVTRISEFSKEIFLAQKILKEIDYGISLGVRLSQPILEEIEDHPTRLYYQHYRAVNHFLDQLAFRVTQYIQEKGYSALPIPASQIVDWEKQRAHLSHKKIAILAGLGWWGRNNLVVNPKFGSQIRLVTILTNMPLKVDTPLEEDCGKCRDCLSVCPVGAIKESPQDFDHFACFEKLREFRKSGYTEQFICGICVKACKGKGLR
ncbi:MAG: hypothetical protein NC821_04630 [Candidatus Omnitrophica bacterium]|nr:hypothetical protein [Candidatus Omnitrophota bacterium]